MTYLRYSIDTIGDAADRAIDGGMTADEAILALIAVIEDLMGARPCDSRCARLAHHICAMRSIMRGKR